jgi:hypothetical protein
MYRMEIFRDLSQDLREEIHKYSKARTGDSTKEESKPVIAFELPHRNMQFFVSILLVHNHYRDREI